jgi:hypothetical protein
MFRNWTQLKGCRLGARDGEIGKVADLLFEDQNWTVRYLVADTGFWLADRLVLLSPHALREFDDREKVLHVELTRQQIEESPPITADQPVSRQFEADYYNYYGWPVYWAGPALWGPGPYPLYYAPLPSENSSAPASPILSGDPHLRSAREIVGYQIHAQDGDIGHVDDFVIEDRSWVVRYLAIDTGSWLPGKKVLIAPPWITRVSWERSTISADLPQRSVQQAPEYDKGSPLTRDYEIRLFQHYSRAGYWEDQQAG